MDITGAIVKEPRNMEENNDTPNKRKGSAKEAALNGVESILVVALFLLFYNFLNLTWAIVAATVASLWLVYSRHRRGIPIGKFLPIIATLIIARGILGIVTDNEDIYFGAGIAQAGAVGLVLMGSVWFRRNLLVVAAPYLFDFTAPVQKHPVYSKTLDHLAYIAGTYYILKAGFDFWLLLETDSANRYVIIKTLVSWPLGILLFWGCLFYAAKKFTAIPSFEGFASLMERQGVIYKEAIHDRSKSIKSSFSRLKSRFKGGSS